MSGMDWNGYTFNEVHDYDQLNVDSQPNRWSSLQVSWLYPNLTSDSNWVMENKYYDKSSSLMHLLQRIQSESGNDFSREHAELLASFLDHLIRIQEEQLDVAYGLYQHLEQLRKSDAASALANSFIAADDNADRDRFSKHPIYKCMWQQKHVFDSLYIMSRESTWLLSKLEASRSSSPSFVKESHKIHENIMLFISKFKKSKYLLDECCPFVEDEIMELVLRNERLLDDFGKCTRDLKEQGVGRNYVAKMLLGCSVDVVSKVECYSYCAERRNRYVVTACSSIQGAFSKDAKETSEMINEALETLNSVRFSTLSGGGSPLGNIT